MNLIRCSTFDSCQIREEKEILHFKKVNVLMKHDFQDYKFEKF